MRHLPLVILTLLALPLTGCGGGGGGGSKSDTPTTTPTSTRSLWAADLTSDNLGSGWTALGEGDTTLEVLADGRLDFTTVKLGRQVRANGEEWYGGGVAEGWLLRVTYDATAKTLELRRVVTGQRVLWTLTAMPAGAG